MTAHGSPQYTAALRLAELLMRAPDLTGAYRWSVTPDGRVIGKHESPLDRPSLVGSCATVTGGTPSLTSYRSEGDVIRVTELQVVWRGVSFDIWESCPARGSDVAARLRAVFAGDYPAELIPAGGAR
ncbi:hypothetical protein PV392_29490 [Streptomyces sp. ME03-5709C]|nr:hypothetical protein [Streptomyces sp. ME03-5709C]